MSERLVRTRIQGLDFLRTVAIVAVVLYHFPKSENQIFFRAVSHYGWAGVDLFFVLSGFLIGGQYFSQISLGRTPSYRSLYLRRLFRTFPAYYMMLIIYFFLAIYRHQAFEGFWRYLFFLQNFGLPAQFSQSWSLCIEEHFYLAFPVVLSFVSRWSGRRAILSFVFLLGVGVFARAASWLIYRPDLLFSTNVGHSFEIYLSRIYYPTYSHLDGILFGLALSFIKNFYKTFWAKFTMRGNYLLGAGILLIAIDAFVLRESMGFVSCVLGFPLLALTFSLLILAADGKSVLNCHIPFVRTIAASSYSIYLTHQLAIEGVHVILATSAIPSLVYLSPVLSIMTILLLGGLLYLLVEKPFLKLRDRMVPLSASRQRV